MLNVHYGLIPLHSPLLQFIDWLHYIMLAITERMFVHSLEKNFIKEFDIRFQKKSSVPDMVYSYFRR